ncbi:MAG: alanine dehydrogenase [Sphingobacteriales bacterium BACL12 MAG-120802-bin5]|nr:MAG: alanine dehydrogenase [Sphingobacteriales bacterium BACL12 MAG-120802-bin5]
MVMEKMLESDKKQGRLFIGIPKENSFYENRVPLTPESVETLTNNGHRLVIESKAGEASRFSDKDYSEAGARIVYDKKEVYEADILIKVAPPSAQDMELMHTNQTIISPLHLPTLKKEIITQLISKQVTALAFEYIQDESNTYSFVRCMSEIAGSSSILIASELLATYKPGRGILLGGLSGIPPTQILILGAGVVGEFAARAAIGLGATVKIYDNNVYKLSRLQNNIGARVYTSVINPKTLLKDIRTADVLVGAIHSELGRTPIIVSEAMVMEMKSGSVIIDVSIDQGGCIETSEVTTHAQPTYIKHDVIHYCVPNIPSRVPRTASYSISNIVTNTLLKFSDYGGLEHLVRYNEGIRHGVYIYKGHLTNEYLGQKFDLKYNNINLLVTSEM